MNVRKLTASQRDELDAWVKGLGWDEEAVVMGSEKRRMVAARLYESGLVEGEVKRLFKRPEQYERMAEYTRTKMTEKITGLGIDSRDGQWNRGNLWDPTAGTSFAGWARRLAYAIARTNAPRVLHRRTANDSSFEGEDGYNPVYDEASSRALAAGSLNMGAFARHPRLTVPRPLGADRARLLKELGDGGEGATVALARRLGWWHRSMDMLEEGEQCSLLLTPLHPNAVEPFIGSVDEGLRECAALYAPTQMERRKADETALNGAVRRYAATHGVYRWDVWCALGTAAARLAVP